MLQIKILKTFPRKTEIPVKNEQKIHNCNSKDKCNNFRPVIGLKVIYLSKNYFMRIFSLFNKNT